MYKGKEIERISKTISNNKKPLYCTAFEPNIIRVAFNKKALTKKELENYTIEIYLYKDKKYKTKVANINIASILNKPTL